MRLRRRGRGPGWRRMLPGPGETSTWIVALGSVLLAFLIGYLLAAQILFPPGGQAVDAPVVRVPDLEGLAVEDARDRLDEVGLEAEVTYRPAAPDVDSGTVMGQRPLAGGATPSDAAVELTVSRGPGGLRLPGLRGLTEDRARSILEALGLEVRSRREPSSVRTGEVVGTEPPSGTVLPPSREVRLVVSEGPEVIRVPELVGRHVDDVPGLLRGQELTLGAVEFDPGAAAAPGRVVGQSPPPGFALRRGGTVSVRVAGARGDWSPPAVVEPPGDTAEVPEPVRDTAASGGG